jgi:hypothetical protein
MKHSKETLFLAIHSPLPIRDSGQAQKYEDIQETFSIEVTLVSPGYLRRKLQCSDARQNAKRHTPYEEQRGLKKKIAGALRIAQAAYPDKGMCPCGFKR